jgi:cellobiose phosphorylase
MAINKSRVYGMYGGVTTNNLYVPPPTLPYNPASPPLVFRQQDKDFIEQFRAQASWIGENADNVLMRINTSSIPNNTGERIDTFVMSTSGKPADILTYTSPTNKAVISLGVVSGGNNG